MELILPTFYNAAAGYQVKENYGNNIKITSKLCLCEMLLILSVYIIIYIYKLYILSLT